MMSLLFSHCTAMAMVNRHMMRVALRFVSFAMACRSGTSSELVNWLRTSEKYCVNSLYSRLSALNRITQLSDSWGDGRFGCRKYSGSLEREVCYSA